MSDDKPFKKFIRRIIFKIFFLFFTVNISFALLVTGKISSISQCIEMRFWDEKLVTLISFMVFLIKKN